MDAVVSAGRCNIENFLQKINKRPSPLYRASLPTKRQVNRAGVNAPIATQRNFHYLFGNHDGFNTHKTSQDNHCPPGR